ncbi:Ppx/GppA phosphatase family protein [Jiella sp. M17.18]|uniref:Ppx/GppA phosphatase family protein n=1 Tax=Jiella sp. M17.18 TaxID=3234247 RepID=UPI0034DE20F7
MTKTPDSRPAGPPRGSDAESRADAQLRPGAKRAGQDAEPAEDDQHLTKRQRRRRRRRSGDGKSASAGPAKAGGAAAGTGPKEAGAAPAVPRGARKAKRSHPGDERKLRPAAETVAGQRLAAPPRASEAPPPAEAAAPARPPVYAALDLGTNNCRLLIAVPTRPGQFRVIDAFSRIVRLGEGLGRTGSLSRGAMDRALAALSICAQKLSARNVSHARLIATEACRAAANGMEFIEEVAEVTGLNLEIVNRETEARLAVSGCGSLIDRDAQGAVLFDIGGGSSEIALLDLRGPRTRRLASRIVAWTSLPIGVVTLAERHGGREVTPEVFERMVAETVSLIEAFPGRDRLESLLGSDRFHLLGTSGTVTTLAGVHLNLERYDRRQVDGLWLTDAEADALVDKIAGWSFEERVANPCIGSDRADLVLAGCAILQAIRRVWPAKTLRVADRGLREGLLTEMMVADGVWRRNGMTGGAQR